MLSIHCECHQVTVTNLGAEEAAWSVILTIPGTVNNSWNTERSGDTGDVTFVGVTWNRSLGPGASAMFGYCFER